MRYRVRLSSVLPGLLTLVVLAKAQSANSLTGNGAKPTGSGKVPIVLPPEKANPVKMPKFEKTPLIDGKLDDEVCLSINTLCHSDYFNAK